jgi:hypothetical protein
MLSVTSLPKQFVESNFDEGWINGIPSLMLTPRSTVFFGHKQHAGSKGLAFDGLKLGAFRTGNA